MKLSRDLTHPSAIHAKGLLFVGLGLVSATLILIQLPTLKTAALLGVTVWAFCRFYYYLFYVLERYLGRDKRFAGVCAALRFLLRAKSRPTKH